LKVFKVIKFIKARA